MIKKKRYIPPKIEFDEVEDFPLLAGTTSPVDDKTGGFDDDDDPEYGGGDGGGTGEGELLSFPGYEFDFDY